MKAAILILGLLSMSSCSTPLFIMKRNIELYQIEENGKIGYMDQKGKTRIEPRYQPPKGWNYNSECTINFNPESFAIVKDSGEYILIDWKGTKMTPSSFEKLIKDSDSTFIAKKNGKYGLVNQNGEEIIPFIFSSKYFINDEKMFPSKIDSQPVIYHSNGSITNMSYDYISPFMRGYAKVETNNKVGLINYQLDLVFDTVYQKIGLFSSNLVNVKIDNKWQFF